MGTKVATEVRMTSTTSSSVMPKDSRSWFMMFMARSWGKMWTIYIYISIISYIYDNKYDYNYIYIYICSKDIGISENGRREKKWVWWLLMGKPMEKRATPSLSNCRHLQIAEHSDTLVKRLNANKKSKPLNTTIFSEKPVDREQGSKLPGTVHKIKISMTSYEIP